MEVIVSLNLVLDVGQGLDFIRQLRCIHEVRIDFGEIHHGQVQPRELVDREALALLFLRRTPRLVDLGAALRARQIRRANPDLAAAIAREVRTAR